MKLFKGILVAACAAFLFACGGGSPLDKMITHSEKAISIVEANKNDLDKAAKEIEAYVAANKAEFEAIEKEAKGLAEKFKADPEGAAKMIADMQAKVEPLEKRIKALEAIEGFKEHEALQNALGSLRGGM